jgi:hypothetical protein
MANTRFDPLRFLRHLFAIAVAPLVATAYVFLVLPFIYAYQGLAKLAATKYRLRSLVIATAVAPPLLWGLYVLLQPSGRLFWVGCFLTSLAICAPLIVLRLNLPRFKL